MNRVITAETRNKAGKQELQKMSKSERMGKKTERLQKEMILWLAVREYSEDNDFGTTIS